MVTRECICNNPPDDRRWFDELTGDYFCNNCINAGRPGLKKDNNPTTNAARILRRAEKRVGFAGQWCGERRWELSDWCDLELDRQGWCVLLRSDSRKSFRKTAYPEHCQIDRATARIILRGLLAEEGGK